MHYFLLSPIEKFNHEYCIAYNADNNEVKLIRNVHLCYRDNIATDLDPNGNPAMSSVAVNYPYHGRFHPMAINDDSLISFTLINEGRLQTVTFTSLVEL